jgi:histidyl-tRNA synthetase
VSSELGAQSTVLGGGRYDGLVTEMGGPPTPAVGFGSGIERALAIMEAQGIEAPVTSNPQVFVITLGEAPREIGVKLLADLRHAGIAAETDYSGKSMKSQMKAADREQARFVAIIGEDELNQGVVKVRNMATKEETAVPVGEAVEQMKRMVL